MRELKFRLWLDGQFSYWGFIENGFCSPARSSGEVLTSKQAGERSEQYTGLNDKKCNSCSSWCY